MTLEADNNELSLETFEAYVASGGIVQATDPMPQAYKTAVGKVVSFQTLAEVVGQTLFSEWLDKVPGLRRKLILTAKCQDELGHAQVLARVAEDLGFERTRIYQDYLAGRIKLLNIFHYRIESWPELPIAALLQNSAAIVQFQSLVKGSYYPYVRALQKIMREESFHYHQAIDLATTIREGGNDWARKEMQRGVDKWFPLLLAYFGPPDKDGPVQQNMRWRIKVDFNDDLRQRWLEKMVPVLHQMGLEIHDPRLRKREDGVWEFTSPDWEEVKWVIQGNGPASQERLATFTRRFQDDAWLRHALAA
jgi:ring-1,2-phenylacetyl-CoA epoxidase subunit PaaA